MDSKAIQINFAALRISPSRRPRTGLSVQRRLQDGLPSAGNMTLLKKYTRIVSVQIKEGDYHVLVSFMIKNKRRKIK